jgi:hypothetical protein
MTSEQALTPVPHARGLVVGESWAHLPEPDHTGPLGFTGVFSNEDSDLMMLGYKPSAPADRWFIYFADRWLRFHNSWTGAQVYGLRLDGSPVGLRVAKSWVNRDPAQYIGQSAAYERLLVRYLIDTLLLGRPNAVFPQRQHDVQIVIGRSEGEIAAPFLKRH